ncbi:MAG: hypothetical protein EA392_00635, partial [Cryomorphaceae bacterium]
MSAQPYCDQAQTTAGFPGDLNCQNAVCAQDGFCCTTSWDALCANIASTNPSCSNCLESAAGGGGGGGGGDCTYSICLYDTFGDGWNGGSATVTVNGIVVLSNITLATGAGPLCFNFAVPEGATIAVLYTAGSWAFENHYTVFSGAGGTGNIVFASPVGQQPLPNNSFASGCGGGGSDPGGDGCEISVCLYDTFGDGWDSATLTVQVGGVNVLTGITLPNGTGPQCFNFTVQPGQNITFLYSPGVWPTENYYQVFSGPSGTGTQIFSTNPGSAPPNTNNMPNECPEWNPDPGGGNPISTSSTMYSAEELITDVLLGDCVSASNVTYTGAAHAIGNFWNGCSFGMEEGILLTTGNVNIAPGPNNSGSAGVNNGTPGFPLLQDLAGALTYDAAVITFEFVASADQVTFTYVFGSEEYPEFVCTGFNDAFGFFVTGPGYAPNTNVALVPGTNDPVTINNVNNNGAACPPHYPQFYVDNTGGQCLQYDGFTTPLEAVINTVPCETYSITIAIADAGDGIYDSGVFLQAQSFSAGTEVDLTSATSGDTQDAYEGCDDGYFTFILSEPLDEPFTIEFEISGTATMGEDYTPIPSSITFQPGQDTIIIVIEALLDDIIEGPESVIITVLNSCDCEPQEAILWIIDNEPLEAEISPDQEICAGQSITLSANAWGSNSVPYHYQWSTGESGQSITVSPSSTTTYTMTVDDGCAGQVITLPVTVTVVDEFFEEVEDEICPGQNYTLPDGTVVSSAGTYVNLLSTSGGCDSTLTVILSEIPVIEVTEEDEFCEGETYVLPDGSETTTGGTFEHAFIAQSGCDSIVTTILTLLPILESEEEFTICEGETVTLPDGTETSDTGSYETVLQSVVTGCDSIVTTFVVVNPPLFEEEEVSICEGEFTSLPDGSEVNEAGIYDVTLQSVVTGCDSTITTTVIVNPLLFSEQEFTICEDEFVVLPDGSEVNQAGVY